MKPLCYDNRRETQGDGSCCSGLPPSLTSNLHEYQLVLLTLRSIGPGRGTNLVRACRAGASLPDRLHFSYHAQKMSKLRSSLFDTVNSDTQMCYWIRKWVMSSYLWKRETKRLLEVKELSTFLSKVKKIDCQNTSVTPCVRACVRA